MAETYQLKPDKAFTEEIVKNGGETLKQCYQCATCSVTCDLSPDDRPFPRKEMIWAQWGLKDKLLGDPDVWLCHRCSDCSTHCPRGAAPGDVLAAVRDYSIKHYAFPGFMGKLVGNMKLLPLLLLVPAALIALLISSTGNLGTPLNHEGHVEYSLFLPHIPLQLFYGLLVGFAAFAAVIGASRYWKNMEKHSPPVNGSGKGFIPSFIATVMDILTHSFFKKCTQAKNRHLSHLLTLYGFLGLFITTCAVVVSEYVFHYYPLPLMHPLKIFGNLSTILMVVGVSMIIYDRSVAQKDSENTTGKDWTFIWILNLLVFTGIATETFRYLNMANVAYPVYFIHLVAIFALLVYLPYSRFAHMIYRTVALIYARHAGRKLGGESD